MDSRWPSALLGALLLWPLAARADPPARRRAALRWIGPPDAEACTPGDTLARSVSERLKRPVFVPDGEADVMIEARIEHRRAPRGWHASIKLMDAAGGALGTREIESREASCSSLDEPLVLVIALLIDPDVALGLPAPGPTEAPPAPAEPPPAPPPSAPPAPPEPPPAARPRPRPSAPPRLPQAPPSPPLRFHAELGLIFSLGLVPGAGTGAVLRAALTPPHFWGIQVEGTYWPRTDVRVDAVGGYFSAAYGGLALCPLDLRPQAFRVSLCAGGQVGEIEARGFGFDSSSAGKSLLVNASLEGRVRYRPSEVPVAVTLGLSGVVPILRPRFFYQLPDGSTRDLFRLSPVIGTLDLGIGVELP